MRYAAPARPLALMLAATLMLGAAPASSRLHYRIDAATSSVNAKVAFFGLASKTATFPKVSGDIRLTPGDLRNIDLDVAIDARALKASDGVTERRLKGADFFDVANHPQVTFSGQQLVMTGKSAGVVSGDLTARGITRPVKLAVTFSAPPASATGKERFLLTGSTTINRRDFGMTAYSAIVGKKVTITIRAQMTGA